MRSAVVRVLGCMLVSAVGGCAVTPRAPPAAATTAACVGAVAPSAPGLAPIDDAALLAEAVRPAGDGGICIGATFVTTAPVRVYRMWDSGHGNIHGSWWVFEAPAGTRAGYREAYAICPEWNALDRSVSCRLKPGTRVAVGPGQSARCENGAYPPSAANQVFISATQQPVQLRLEDCVTGDGLR